MNRLEIKDLGSGQLQTSWQPEGSEPRLAQPAAFADPLSTTDRADLRWYLERYLDHPYEAELQRAVRFEQRLGELGEALFHQAFGPPDSEARGLFDEAERAGLEACELTIQSDQSVFLSLPWELLHAPGSGRGPLGERLGGIARVATGPTSPPAATPASDGPLRVLLVSARPHGRQEPPRGPPVRALFEALRALRPGLELELLRAPTLDALKHRLTEQPGAYDVVHFDGHAQFGRAPRAAPPEELAKIGLAELAFEQDGSSQPIACQELVQLLAGGQVAILVLSACQPEEERPPDPASSLATWLVARGLGGALVLPFCLAEEAAAAALARFYGRLLEGASIAEAGAAARRALLEQPERASVAGSRALRDWLVPTVYQREGGFTPRPTGVVASEDTPAEPDDTERLAAVQAACPPGPWGFIGRGHELLRIEAALQDASHPWVVLTGPAGIGKSAIAAGFAHWYVASGGCSAGVFRASFRRKAEPALVISSLAGYGAGLAHMPEEDRWRHLVSYLRQRECLLIWDDLEGIAGSPDGAETESQASEEQRQQLSRFLRALRGGRTRVLITTRRADESWLGVIYEAVEVAGLPDREATELAVAILTRAGLDAASFQSEPDYARLVHLLRGEPPALAVVLPWLRDTGPSELLTALQARLGAPGAEPISAAFEHAVDRLSPIAQQRLPCWDSSSRG